MLTTLVILALLSGAGFLLIKRASLSVWVISYALVALLLFRFCALGILSQSFLWLGFALIITAFIKPLRTRLITQFIFRRARNHLPPMSATEREALEAGTVGWEGALFSGAPDFNRLLAIPAIALTAEEQAFLNGPTYELCGLINDWDITHHHSDIPPQLWGFIKQHGFLGMIIPKQYGGLEFSAAAQMAVLVKLYGCSVTVATTVGVPNSLGPAELLLKYGTEAQKNYYLPRLASGEEIPCFALTGPHAGSDAASIPDVGIVCRQLFNGKEELGIRLTWDKRYITLAPVATVIGLAFKMRDPDNLLGKGFEVGISCVLIPADTPGVIRGRRHFPLNTGFLNGPTQGTNVFVPMSYLIGGVAMAGNGWRMLMECLSVGRAISLPSSASGGSQIAVIASGAYARIRKQFNQPIGRFEGIEAPLARIAGNAYMIDAALSMTASLIDQGEKPSVAGAILKYHTTERARQISFDAMDIHGGKGICLGPNNYLGRGYQQAPISITVEGANILTRNLIIFGQGAVRCHPYVFREMESLRENDLNAFDAAFSAHAAFFLSNLAKSIVFTFTDGKFLKCGQGVTERYYQHIYQYSTTLAFLTDFSMSLLGGALKRREAISARLGDILSNLYLASGVLKRFHDDNEPHEDLPLVSWCCQQLFYNCDIAIKGLIENFPIRWARVLLKTVLQPFGMRRQMPSDVLDHAVASLIIEPSQSRARLGRWAYYEANENCAVGRLNEAFLKVCEVEKIEKKISKAVKENKLQSLTLLDQIQEALRLELISKNEAKAIDEAEKARLRALAVDDFSHEELSRTALHQEGTSKKKQAVKSILPA